MSTCNQVGYAAGLQSRRPGGYGICRKFPLRTFRKESECGGGGRTTRITFCDIIKMAYIDSYKSVYTSCATALCN